MKLLKSIAVVFITLFTLIAGVFSFSACGKTEGKSKIFIVSAETFKENVDLTKDNHLDGGFSVDELYEKRVTVFDESKVYYALVYISDTVAEGKITFKSDASFSLGEPISTKSGEKGHLSLDLVSGSESYYEIKRNKNAKKTDSYAALRILFGKMDSLGTEETESFFVTLSYSDKLDQKNPKSSHTAGGYVHHEKQITAASSVKYLSEDDYGSENIDPLLKDSYTAAVGEKFYAVIDYTLSNYVSVEETETAMLSISSYTQFEVEDIPTHDYVKNGNLLKATFKLSSGGTGEKRFRFIIGITAGESAGEIKAFVSSSEITFLEKKACNGSFNVDKSIKLESRLGFELSSDGTYYILSSIGKENSDVINIPAKYKDLPVKEIAADVFSYSAYIKEIVLPSGIEKIGNNAFKACTGIKSITVPASVVNVGGGAFAECPDIEILCASATKPTGWSSDCTAPGASVIWNYSKDLFVLNEDKRSYTFTYKNVTDAEHIAIPENYGSYPVTGIAEDAFAGCVNLRSVKFPSEMTLIYAKAFSDCKELEKITVAEGNKVYRSLNNTLIHIEDKTLTLSGKNGAIPSDLQIEIIGDYAFSGRMNSEELIIPDNVISIGKHAFSGCGDLKSVTVSDNVTSIGEYAFFECKALKTVSYGQDSKLIEIGNAAFYRCSALTRAELPKSTEKIGASAFQYCSSVTYLYIPENVTSIGDMAFYSCRGLTEIIFSAVHCMDFNYNNQTFASLGEETEGATFVIGDSVTSVPKHLLDPYEGALVKVNVKKLVIGKGVASIGTSAFRGCRWLTEIEFNAKECADVTADYNPFYNAGIAEDGIAVTFGHEVKRIPAYLFYAWSSVTAPKIKTVKVGDSVISIGECAFFLLKEVTEVVLPESLTLIEWRAFYGCQSISSINYRGSEEDWSNVTKENGWDMYDNNGLCQIEYTMNYNFTE